MKTTKELQALGQSLWLDNITRDLLNSGTMQGYINDYAVTGLTSNPTIFNQAIGGTADYDASIQQKVSAGKSGESLFFELAIDDLKHQIPATSGTQPGFSQRMQRPVAWMAGCRWKCPRYWSTMLQRPSRPPNVCMPLPTARTCSSKSQVHRLGCRR